MTADTADEPVPPSPDREAAMLPAARTALRRWLAAPPAAVTEEIERLGRDAIREAADASARLLRHAPALDAAERVLGDVAALAAGLEAPPPPRSRWWSTPRAATPPGQDLSTLAGRLEQQRDTGTRALIGLEADRTRVAAAETALADAVHLARALNRTIAAAAREMRGQDPARARWLADDAAARLDGRRHDLLVQIVVTRQGLATLDLMLAQQTGLVAALERARTATVAALRTAAAARAAVATDEALSRYAAPAAPAGAGGVRRALEDAVAQARAALGAAARPRDG